MYVIPFSSWRTGWMGSLERRKPLRISSRSCNKPIIVSSSLGYRTPLSSTILFSEESVVGLACAVTRAENAMESTSMRAETDTKEPVPGLRCGMESDIFLSKLVEG
jgi:hypothetical protein